MNWRESINYNHLNKRIPSPTNGMRALHQLAPALILAPLVALVALAVAVVGFDVILPVDDSNVEIPDLASWEDETMSVGSIGINVSTATTEVSVTVGLWSP
jgi:hypothetical protein